MNELRKIISQRVNVKHLFLWMILVGGVTVGIVQLSIIFGWLCCMESPAGSVMFSNLTFFSLITSDLLIICFGLYLLYRNAENKQRLDYQKTFFIIGIIIFVLYLVYIPYALILNS